MEASVVGAFSQEPVVVQSLRLSEPGVIFPVRTPQEVVRHRTFAKPVIPAFVLFFVLVLQVCVRLEFMNLGYELHLLRSEALRRDSLLRELRLQAAQLSSPSEISKRAPGELRLIPTPPQNVRRVILAAQPKKK